MNTEARTCEYSTSPFRGPEPPAQDTLKMRPSRLSSPLPDDLLCVTGHMVVADDMVQAGQGLLNVLLQPLQVLCLLVHGDDGVLQLHQAALEGRQDGHLRGEPGLSGPTVVPALLPDARRPLAFAACPLVIKTICPVREGTGAELFTTVSSAPTPARHTGGGPHKLAEG